MLFSVLLHAYEKQFMANRREIRNSTAEFLIFQIEGKEQGIEVYYKDKTIWCTQKAMSMLFNCSTDNIGLHLKNIYDSGDLDEKATTEKISVVRQRRLSREQRPCNTVPPKVMCSIVLCKVKKATSISDMTFYSTIKYFV